VGPFDGWSVGYDSGRGAVRYMVATVVAPCKVIMAASAMRDASYIAPWRLSA